MKKQFGWVMAAVAAMALTLTSCKKDNHNPTPAPAPAPTKTELITTKSWKMISMVSAGYELYNFLPACEKDDFITFKKGNSYVEDEGATKCEPADPQTETGSWKFIQNETAFILDNEDTLTLRKLATDTLRVELAIEDDEGNRGTALVTFISK